MKKQRFVLLRRERGKKGYVLHTDPFYLGSEKSFWPLTQHIIQMKKKVRERGSHEHSKSQKSTQGDNIHHLLSGDQSDNTQDKG